MVVEVLKSEDLLSYKKLIDDCFGSGNDISQYQKYQENQSYTIFVVKDGSEIVGSATQYSIDLFTFSFQPCLMLFNVAVKADCRRRKIGQSLLEHIIEYAKNKGYHSISLTCLGDAYPAHKLYESAGFTKSGSIKYEMHL